jgi:hypothetical protein
MTEPYILWALVVGFAIGVALTWFALGRLARKSDDVGPEERLLEASWISSTITGRGQHASEEVVEEVLRLHEAYLAGPAPHLTPEERDLIAAEQARRAEAALRRARAEDKRAAQPRPPTAATAETKRSERAPVTKTGEG